MYSIVEFEDGILAIPSRWISATKKFCRYPPKQVKNAIINNEAPSDDWLNISITKIFGQADDYKTAKEKTAVAIETSDLDDDNLRKTRSQRKRKLSENTPEKETKKNKTKPKKIVSDSSYEESNDEDNGNSQSLLGKKYENPPVKLGKNKSKDKKKTVTEEDDDLSLESLEDYSEKSPSLLKKKKKRFIFNRQNYEKRKSDSPLNSIERTTVDKPEVTGPSTTLASSSGDKSISKMLKDTSNMSKDEKVDYLIGLQEENFKKNNRILIELGNINKKLEKQPNETAEGNSRSNVADKIKKINRFFPLKTTNDVEEFEKALKDENFMEETTTVLSRRGGKEYSDLTNNIMFKIMTDDLAEQYSYKGRQKKLKFQACLLSKCVLAAVSLVFPEQKEHEVELKIGTWLANATTRNKRKKTVTNSLPKDQENLSGTPVNSEVDTLNSNKKQSSSTVNKDIHGNNREKENDDTEFVEEDE